MAQKVLIDLDKKRVLMFRHKELRDLVNDTGKSIGELMSDPFGGWPHVLRYGLRYQDNKVTLDQCSDFIDIWVEAHKDEPSPMKSLCDKLMEALDASGFIKLTAEGAAESAEGNATPEP
jgi:hypothetical protein